MLRIGVLIPGEVEHLGEFLADARALETAGADALWLDRGAQDPWMLAAALSTVTSRVRLGIGMAAEEDPGVLATRVRTLGRLSRGRTVLRSEVQSLEVAVALARAGDGCRVFGHPDEERLWAHVAEVADGLLLTGSVRRTTGPASSGP